jgi:hypothetical protein
MQTWIYACHLHNSILGISYEGAIGIWPLVFPDTPPPNEGLREILPATIYPTSLTLFPSVIQKVIKAEKEWLILGNNIINQLQVTIDGLQISDYLTIKNTTDIAYHAGNLLVSTINGEIKEYHCKDLVHNYEGLEMRISRIAVNDNILIAGSTLGEVAVIDWNTKQILHYIYPSLGISSDIKLPLSKSDCITALMITSSWAVYRLLANC